MDSPTTQPTQPTLGIMEEERSSFNLLEWVLRVLRYWYLFIIGIVIALALAMLENRKWIPQYLSSGTILIKEYTNSYGGSQALMQGFGVGRVIRM